MKTLITAFILLIVSACAAITADPWGWLDDPEQQAWKEVVINGNGREIRFSIPDRLKPGGQHVRFWPEMEKGGNRLSINLPAENLHEPVYRVVQFIWDEYWGGFYKKGNYDFHLDVWVWFHAEDINLLDLTAEQRVQRQFDHWEDVFSEEDWQTVAQRERFFSQYWAKPYKNSHGGTWVVDNLPQVTADHEVYRIPLSDHHELEFSFFVRDKRYELKEDPEWQKRRWDMVQQIMSTVSIDPNPFPDD